MESLKYYGSREIKDVSPVSESGLVTLSFTDGTSVEISAKLVSEVVTDKVSDETTLRDKKCFPVVAKILEVYLTYNVNIEDIDYISQRVIMSLNESLKQADQKIWGKSREEKTMNDIQKVLLDNKKGDIISPYQADK